MLRVYTASRVRAIEELIDALDRRVPHIERAGESRIAGDAQILRRDAVMRLAELTRAEPDDGPSDQEFVEAIMTDDGGPARACERHEVTMQRSDAT